MATKQFEADAASIYRLDALRVSKSELPAGVAIRVIVDTEALTRADAMISLNVIAKALGDSSNWPME